MASSPPAIDTDVDPFATKVSLQQRLCRRMRSSLTSLMVTCFCSLVYPNSRKLLKDVSQSDTRLV